MIIRKLFIFCLVLVPVTIFLICTYHCVYLMSILHASNSASLSEPIGLHSEHHNMKVKIRFRDDHKNFPVLRAPRGLAEMCTPAFSRSNPNGRLPLLAIVLSHPNNTEYRRAMRETWASPNHSLAVKMGHARVFFILGKESDSQVDAIEQEFEDHNDIFTIDMKDLYDDLAYKVLAEFQIAMNWCKADFLLKIDDDTVFHIDRFIEGIDRAFHTATPAFYCYTTDGVRPIRDKEDKWYDGVYKGKTYPTYCSGPNYIVNHKAIRKILAKTSLFPKIRIEDALISGVIAEAAKVERVHYEYWILFPIWEQRWHDEWLCSKTEWGSRAMMSYTNQKSRKAIAAAWATMNEQCTESENKEETSAEE